MPKSTANGDTLVVFCRRPAPGTGKRRLARQVGETTALVISQHLLAATLEDAAAWPGPVIIAPAEPADEVWARSLTAAADDVVLQPSGNLGDRLADVDKTLRRRGHTRILYMGSDAPVLGPADYAAAREGLATHDVVLGPATDGGVTLMGSRQPWPTLTDLPWSSDRLHKALQAACERSGQRVLNLAPRYDIDVSADLTRLCVDLAGDPRPARRSLYQALHSLGYCNS